MNLTHCPDRELLCEYSVGRLAADQFEEVAEHVEGCSDCQAELMTLDDAGDTLLSQLRKECDEPYLNEPLFEVAMEEAIRMPRSTPPQPSQTSSFVPHMMGEYELLEELGRGGMGRVYRARHTKLDRTVAVKILSRGRLDDPRAIHRFEREMRAIGRLNHPHVVHAYDAREIDHMPVLIMEYIDGLDLEQLASRLGPLPVTEACEIVRQAALGLQYAHEHGLVHRDVKPSNIMLTQGGEVKLMDLGLARFCVEPTGDEMTHEGQMMGTADYVAPEQVDDSRMVDIRADIYSLGCTLYRLLAGRPPFSGPEYRGVFDKLDAHVHQTAPPITQFVSGLPTELVAVLDRMLAKQAEDRFAEPAEVVRALGPLSRDADLSQLVNEARKVAVPPVVSLSPFGAQAVGGALGSKPAVPERRSLAGRWVSVGLWLSLLGIGFAAGVVVTIHRNGKATKLEVPDGSHVRIGEGGDVDVVLPPEVVTGPAETTDSKALQGVWDLIAMRKNGTEPPANEVGVYNFTFHEDGSVLWQGDGVRAVSGTYELDAEASPKTIDIAFPQKKNEIREKALGIYRLEKDRLFLAIGEPGDPRPRSFDTSGAASRYTSMELRRSDKPVPTPEEIAQAQAATDAITSETLMPLRDIGIAMHRYHDQYKSFPPAVLMGPDGVTPYSWRVAVLPLLGHQELYDRYRRDEPWNSPHNVQLLTEMPHVYRAPGAAFDTTETSAFALVGRDTPFPSPHEGSRFVDMTDGTSNTILLVRAARGIPWTQPEDIAYDSQMALPSFGGFYANGFHALFADGAVHFLPHGLDESLLRAMITRGGGEPFEFPRREIPQRLPQTAEEPMMEKPAQRKLPTAAHMFIVNVDADGQLKLNGSPITKEVLLKEVGAAARGGGVDVQLKVAPELRERQARELLDQLKAAGAASVNLSAVSLGEQRGRLRTEGAASAASSMAMESASSESRSSARLDFRIAPVVEVAENESNGSDQPGMLTPQTTLPAAAVEGFIKDLRTHGPRSVPVPQLEGGATASLACAWYEAMDQLPQSEIVTAVHEGRTYVLLSTRPEDVLLSGDKGKPWSVEEAESILDDYNYPCISLRLDDVGGEALSTLSKQHIGDHLAILLNDRVVTVPRLVSQVGQKIRITGSFTPEQIEELVQVLKGQTPGEDKPQENPTDPVPAGI